MVRKQGKEELSVLLHDMARTLANRLKSLCSCHDVPGCMELGARELGRCVLPLSITHDSSMKDLVHHCQVVMFGTLSC